MPDDDLLSLLLGCGCRKRCCCGAPDPTPVQPAAPLFGQAARTVAPPRLPDESPFIPPIRLATMHALDALLLSPHTRPPLPHAPLWDRGAGVTGPLYAEAPAGQEHPPRVLLGTPGATPTDTPPLTTLTHLRNAERDPLMPYAAGIRDGEVYLRVHDLPAWGHHLRREVGNDWPDDGTAIWVQDRSFASRWRENPETALLFRALEIDPDSPVLIGGVHAHEDGRPLYTTRDVTLTLASGTWRTVLGAQLLAAQAPITRRYLSGAVEVEARTLPVVDVQVRVPPLAQAGVASYNRVVEGVGLSNVGYAATFTLTSSPTPTQRPGTPDYLTLLGTLTHNDPDPRPEFVPSFQPSGTDEVQVTSIPGQSPGTARLTPLALPDRSVRARFIPDSQGQPLADARDAPPQVLLAGALVYEGPLGTLPAPCSGVSATWAGLEVQADGHFTADAWVDGSMLWACLVDAAGQVQVARQSLTPPLGQPPQVRRWSYPTPTGVPSGTPVLTYSFLREGQTGPSGAPAWPTRAGLLAWVAVDGTLTRVSVRTRRSGDPAGSAPVTFEVWPDLPPGVDPRVPLPLHPGTLTPPTAATLGSNPAAPLARWQAPAPGEPGGTKPQLSSVTGDLTLTWADPTGTGRARLASVTFLTSAGNLAARLTAPPGWTVDTDPAGPFVRVTLTPASLAPLTLTLTCAALPIGHPRATLEATPDA